MKLQHELSPIFVNEKTTYCRYLERIDRVQTGNKRKERR